MTSPANNIKGYATWEAALEASRRRNYDFGEFAVDFWKGVGDAAGIIVGMLPTGCAEDGSGWLPTVGGVDGETPETQDRSEISGAEDAFVPSDIHADTQHIDTVHHDQSGTTDTPVIPVGDMYTCLINAEDAFGNKYGTYIGSKSAVTNSISGWAGTMEHSSGEEYDVTFNNTGAKSLSVENHSQQGFNIELTWADDNGIPEEPEASGNNVVTVMTQSALIFSASCGDSDCSKIYASVSVGDSAWPEDLGATDIDGYDVSILTFTIECDQ